MPSVPITKQLKDLFFMIWCIVSACNKRGTGTDRQQLCPSLALYQLALEKGFPWVTDAAKPTPWMKEGF